MKKIMYAFYLVCFALFNDYIGLSKIEQGLSALVSIGILGLFELVSINEKLDK